MHPTCFNRPPARSVIMFSRRLGRDRPWFTDPLRCSFAGGVRCATAAEGYMSILGTRVIRTEDPRLLTAGGVYVDDLRTPELNGAARLTFVRSPLAHARITGIDTGEASREPGVLAVLTARDMAHLPPPPPDAGEGGGEGGPMPLGGPWAEPLRAPAPV